MTVALPLYGPLEILFEETPLPYRVFDKIRRIEDESPLVVDRKRLGAGLAMAKAICEAEPHHFQRNSHVLAGYRKHFENPGDTKSRELREAPVELRRRHRGRPRAPLGQHPIVVIAGRAQALADHYEGKEST